MNKGKENVTLIKVLKIVGGGIDGFFAIPVLGALIMWTLLFVPAVIMLGLHIFTLVMCVKQKKKLVGPILGICANTVGVIPGVGFVLKTLSAIFNIKEGVKNQ